MNLSRQVLCAFIAASLFVIWVLPANAAPVVWTLDGVTRSDGGVVSGSFTYDAATGAYTAINITSVAGISSVPGQVYGENEGSSDATFLYSFGAPIPADLTNENGIFLDFPAPLTDAGGTLTLTVSSSEFVCSNLTCTGTIGPPLTLSGQVTTDATYPILVAVTGLVPSSPPGDASNSIVLLNNGGDAITVVDNGTASFPAQLATGASYDVTIDFPPDNQTCTVTNGMGTVGTAPVTTPTVTCDPPITPTPTPTPATPVPTLSAYGLVLTMIGLLIVAGGYLRTRRKP